MPNTDDIIKLERAVKEVITAVESKKSRYNARTDTYAVEITSELYERLQSALIV